MQILSRYFALAVKLVGKILRWEKEVLLHEIVVKMKIHRNSGEMKKEFYKAVVEVPAGIFRTPIDLDFTRGLFGNFDGLRMMILARPRVRFGLDLLHFSSAYRFYGKVDLEESSNKYLVGTIRLAPWFREFLFLYIMSWSQKAGHLFKVYSAT